MGLFATLDVRVGESLGAMGCLCCKFDDGVEPLMPPEDPDYEPMKEPPHGTMLGFSLPSLPKTPDGKPFYADFVSPEYYKKAAQRVISPVADFISPPGGGNFLSPGTAAGTSVGQ